MADLMIRHAAGLHRLRERTGRTVSLALEPEPCCHMETLDETVRFFERHLFAAPAVAAFGRLAGLGRGESEAALRRHLGVCFDACHMAVEFEDAAAALAGARARRHPHRQGAGERGPARPDGPRRPGAGGRAPALRRGRLSPPGGRAPGRPADPLPGSAGGARGRPAGRRRRARVADPLPRAAVPRGAGPVREHAGLPPRGAAACSAARPTRRTSRSRPTRGTSCPRRIARRTSRSPWRASSTGSSTSSGSDFDFLTIPRARRRLGRNV